MMRFTGKAFVTLNLSVLLIATTGCQNMVSVRHGPLVEPKTRANLTIQVDELAANVRKERPNHIGTHTFSVLAIPGGDINVDRPLPDIMHPFIVESLEKAGYSVVDVRRKKAANLPVFRGEIKNFWFAGYSWLWPLYIQAGNIKYRMVLQRPDGAVLWEKTLTGRSAGVSGIVDAGYDSIVRTAVTEVLNKVIAEVQSDAFQTALRAK